MLIKSISLTNFRCHDTFSLNCEPTTTLILGENGRGKTSVLEAIYILTQGKSFRASDPDIIKREAPFYRAELNYDNGEKVSVSFKQGEKKVFNVMDKKTSRLPAKNKHPVILFLPSDLNLVTSSPTSRRNYYDTFFSVLNSDYASAVNKYNKALVQRNKLLKEPFVSPNAIFPWNVLLAKNAMIIKTFRNLFVQNLNGLFTDTYHSIASNDDEISLKYTTEFNDVNESEYLRLLDAAYEKDKILGHTSLGIQRDSYEFIFNNALASSSASRGETRSIILAQKFNEAKIINDILHVKPIILLDDVFSELDNSRRAALIDNFKNHQVIITSVEKFSNDD